MDNRPTRRIPESARRFERAGRPGVEDEISTEQREEWAAKFAEIDAAKAAADLALREYLAENPVVL